MADHSELVAEMPVLEQMGTQERQKLAKKRRLQQLKKWSQREKEWIAKEKQLNKRLANMLHEENNGLNLKQYTTYSSNHRSKKKLQLTASTGVQNGKNINSNSNNNNNNNIEFLNNNTSNTLHPNGRVHFNVGVMLLEAAARNDYDEVKRLLMLGVSPDSVNHDGLTALHQCCIDASEPMMNLLLEFGANVDAKDTEQWTPLHAACTCGHLNLVKILVENNANLLAVNGDGNMPFDICEDEATLDYIESQMVKRGITQEMIDFTRASTEMQMISDLEKQVAEGRDLNSAEDNGVTQLHIASANGYISVVKFLIKHGVNVNVCDNDLWRPLHGAACWGNEQHIKIVELLVEAGANLNAKTINDETVFDLCDNAELLERLNQLKDEIESKQATGIDRLRRTQSRTNSRVHSVRRTSVRDKNQISRREAREEAMLRVESSPTKAAPDGLPVTMQSNGRSKELDSVNAPCATQSSASLGVGEKTSETNISSELSVTSLEHSTPVLGSINQVDGSLNSRNIVETDMDEAHHHMNGQQKEPTRSQGSFTRSSNAKEDCVDGGGLNHQRKQVCLINNSQLADDADEFIINTTTDSQQQQQALGSGGKVDTNTNSKFHQHHSTSRTFIQNEKTLSPTNASDDYINSCNSDEDNSNDNDTACDPKLQKQQQMQQVAQSLALLAPMNCTLSNLKKQRSDLRMRTTSIGGGSVIPAATGSSTSGQQQQQQQSVVLDPQPSSLQSDCHHRPVSPSLTFRKFSGEPSEVIGGGGRNSGHKCCILI